MNRNRILAHRGHWENSADKNSAAAIGRALKGGFGIETDFRDLDGVVVVSHDPPRRGTVLSAAWLFDLYKDVGATGRIALNVKADGLQSMLRTALDDAHVDISRIFAFDMAIPDTLGYFRAGLPAYSRISEYEPTPSFPNRVVGVWVDNFTGNFMQVYEAKRLLEEGFRVGIVSSELHGRDPEALWSEIREARLHEHPFFEICTDLPTEVHNILGTQ